jgi:predicted metalloprotease
VGPFYCPLDEKIYIDASFFDPLSSQFGADGVLGQEYVVAHEYGHPIQDHLGMLGRAQQDPQGPQSGAVSHRAHGRLPRRAPGPSTRPPTKDANGSPS